MRILQLVTLGLTLAATSAAALPPINTPLTALSVSATTGEKPQSKVWTYADRWWCVMPNSSGTWVWRLDGTAWTNVLLLSASTSMHADVKVVGGVSHVLLFNGASSVLASIEHVAATQSYQMWATRPGNAALPLDGSTETATIDVDSEGRMWLASDHAAGVEQIVVYHSDAPYDTWSGPVTLATGINADDIAVVTALPGARMGVLWSNQNTERFGFRLHVDGADPGTWSTDELPASQSAQNVGSGMADDHLNVAVASDGTLYAAVKTGYDTAGYPKIAMLVRRPAGTWDDLYGIDEAGTRGIVLLDESAGTVTVLYTSIEGSGDIRFKESPAGTIAFGTGSVLMPGGLNDVTSAKQNPAGAIAILAGNGSSLSGRLLTTATSYTIVASAGSGGTITPSGSVVVNSGDSQAFTIAADAGQVIADVLVDGVSVGAVPGYTFDDVLAPHSIAASFAPDVPAGDLVGHWRMDEGAGSGVADDSPNGLHGTALGGPAWVAGVRGPSALSFLNGSSQRVSVPDAAPLNLTGEITLAAWIRPTQVATASILNKATFNTGPPVFGYELNLSTTGVPFVRLFNDTQAAGGGRLNATIPYPTDGTTWMHVAATYDGATIKMYINGVLNVTRSSSAPLTTNTLPFAIGATSDGTPSRVFPGAIDDARLYSRALTGGEIAVLAIANPTHTITASAGIGGSISPSGSVDVSEGTDQEFMIAADAGYHIADVLVDAGSVGPVASYTFFDVTEDHTISASFLADPPPVTSTVDVGAAPGLITLGNPVRTVPVTINRTDATPLLAFSVDLTVSSPLDVAGGPLGFHEGIYLSAANPATSFQVIDLGVDLGGNHLYEVDGTTLGAPCGSSAATGTLFTIDLSSAAAGGSGTVEITDLKLRDCSNADLPWVIGTSSTIGIDQSAPTVHVVAPDGGETWLVGSMQDITWSGSDPEGIASYDLEYSTDGGATYPNAIATVPGSSTSYAWMIPATPGTETRVRVTAHGVNGNLGTDASDANFTIALDIPANRALAFDGVSRHVTFGAAPELGVTNFTVELWFKRTGAGATASSGSGGVVAVPLLAKGRSEGDGDGRDVNYFLGIDAAGHLVADYEEGSGQLSPGLNHPVVGSTVIASDAWYHGAAVFDGNSLRLYLNGVAEGVVSGLAGRNPQSLSTQHSTLATTRNSVGVLAGFFAGEIDEPRIWGVPHSQCEVIASMNSELVSGAGLVGRWGLNEGTGSTAGNSVAGSPDGTLVDGPPWIPGAPFDLIPPAVPNPPAPSDLAAVAPDAHQVVLSWADNAASESGVEIERSTLGVGGPYTLLATVGPDVTSYVDAVLESQTEYCYRVRALGCAGNSDDTPATCATTTEELCRALAFTPNGAGTNAYVRLGNPPALQLSAFTLELWVRRDGAGVATQSASGGIADAVPLVTRGRSLDDVPANNVNYFLCIRQSDGVLAADFEEGSAGPTPGASHPVAGATPLTLGVWHHVAATYDGSTWSLYLDGNLDGQLAVNRPAASEGTARLAFAGALNALGVPAGYLDGAIDEVRIWNVARTESEIQDAMMLAIVSPTAGLVGRWGFDEGVGTNVYGTAGTGIHGTIVGSAVTDWSRVDCVFATVEVEPGPVAELELGPVIPNPSRERAQFEFALPQAGSVRLEILDVRGRRLATLVNEEREAGRHTVRWDGEAGSGGVAAGVYFVRCQALGREFTRRFVLLPR